MAADGGCINEVKCACGTNQSSMSQDDDFVQNGVA